MPTSQKKPARKPAPKKASTRAPSARRAPSAGRASSAGRTRSAGTRTHAAALSRVRHNDRVIARAKKALDTTQKDMGAIRGSVSAGGRDLSKDVIKLLRDTRRDIEKMNTAVRRDLKQLQKDLSKATDVKKRKPARKRAGAAGSSR